MKLTQNTFYLVVICQQLFKCQKFSWLHFDVCLMADTSTNMNYQCYSHSNKRSAISQKEDSSNFLSFEKVHYGPNSIDDIWNINGQA